jgi:hypothetical protein
MLPRLEPAQCIENPVLYQRAQVSLIVQVADRRGTRLSNRMEFAYTMKIQPFIAVAGNRFGIAIAPVDIS